jgi:hypothetical protein
MQWREVPELAEVINAWFNLPQPVIAKIITIVRAFTPP